MRDDIDFLTKLPTEVKDTEQLITFDIFNLYSNISQGLGLEANKYWLGKHPENTAPRFPEEFIIGLKLILENKNFLQVYGTSMGTKMAPTYANLTLVYLEETLYTKIKKNSNQ